MISSTFYPEDLYLLPGEGLQSDTLIVVIGGQTLIFNDISNAQRDFWRNIDQHATIYTLSYNNQTWNLKCYRSTDDEEYPLVGEWERACGRDHWKQYLEEKETV